MHDYFSDRENGPRPRVILEVSPAVWAGLVGVVENLVNTHAFGYRFPDRCPDGYGTCGANEVALGAAVVAEIPDLSWPLTTTTQDVARPWAGAEGFSPPTLVVLDLLEFVFRSVGQPIEGDYHSYYRHNHLSFDVAAGRQAFVAEVNRILARNGLAFDLSPDGRVIRIPPSELATALRRPRFQTGDGILDNLLEESRFKFIDPDPLVRREGLERLWDGWERLKSMADADKQRSIGLILDRAAPEPTFRAELEREARALTQIGNTRLIRHYETSQLPVIDVDHVDYLYHRMFSMIELLIRKNMSGAAPKS